MSRSSPPAPEPTKTALLPVAMTKARWSLRLRGFRRAARSNRIGPEPRSRPQAASSETHWRDLLDGRILERRGEGVGVAAVLGGMPVAVLVPETAVIAENRWLNSPFPSNQLWRKQDATARIKKSQRRHIRCSERCRSTLSGANLHDADLTGASLWGARSSELGSIMQSGLLTSSSRTRIATERRWLHHTECIGRYFRG